MMNSIMRSPDNYPSPEKLEEPHISIRSLAKCGQIRAGNMCGICWDYAKENASGDQYMEFVEFCKVRIQAKKARIRLGGGTDPLENQYTCPKQVKIISGLPDMVKK